nr:phosphate ABC transporter permease subunit PstC [Sulfoacidibacillus ferrooxidans]
MTEGSSPNIYCSIEHPPLKWNGLEFTIHEHGVAKRGQYRVKQQRYGVGNILFVLLIAGSGAFVVLLMGVVLGELLIHAWPAMIKFGPSVLWATVWRPSDQLFGMWPWIEATVISSLIGVVLATVVGTATALVITRMRLRWLRRLSSALVQWLSLIPSVIFGLWGLTFIAPIVSLTMRHQSILLAVHHTDGEGLLLAGLTLGAMLIPTIVAVTRETLMAVPTSIVEGALALGLTINEATVEVILPYARRGIFGAVLLALGRALGETVAVVMVIGSEPQIATSLFSKTDTLTSVIATQWNHGHGQFSHSVLFEAGLLLYICTFIFYTVARMYVPKTLAAARLQLW